MSIETPHLFSVSGMFEVLARRLHGATRRTMAHLLEEPLPGDNSIWMPYLDHVNKQII
jgi:hypothetical protein